MKKVAIVGTQGVPAQYGGFETLTEYLIGEHCSQNIQYTVFCSGKSYENKQKTYKNALLKYIPLDANGMQSILYDIISLIKVIRGYDVVLVLGVSGCIFLPIFRLLYRKKLVINIDGLEHRRDKWGRFTRWFLLQSEAMAVRYADTIISDNKGIYDYVKTTYGKESALIAYGGDHAIRSVTAEQEIEILNKYGLTPYTYALSICRIEPENNCQLIVETFSQTAEKLVFIGNWQKSEFGQKLRNIARETDNISALAGIYDLDELYVIRKNCKVYLHGHSAGGTNPSLVEAMFFARPIWAFDVVYNRESTENKALYFKDKDELTSLIENLPINVSENIGIEMEKIARRRYCWKQIVKEYEHNYETQAAFLPSSKEETSNYTTI